MKITNKMISLPPYISTTWANIVAIYLREGFLVITLRKGECIVIPDLSKEVIEAIFHAHSHFVEGQVEGGDMRPEMRSEVRSKQPLAKPFFAAGKGFANGEQEATLLRIGFDSIEGLGTSAMQHDPSQSNMPPFPSEILNKIAAITKIICPVDVNFIPKAEPHCHCPHCQIVRAIHFGTEIRNSEEKESESEVISNAELQFQQWDIQQSAEKLFLVTNKLDTKETYSVYLGEPVGCTCGKQGCEHILAVLKS